MKDIVPKDTRYIPLTQQKSCCVPTCIQMVMLRHGIPLKPVEEIGYYLGLTVPPDRKHLFYNVRTSPKKPKAGYGTRIYDPKYEPNQAFAKLDIPLRFKFLPVSKFNSASEIKSYFKKVLADNLDVLLCFHHGVLVDDPSRNWGHVSVFDIIKGDKLRIIDPSQKHPKWRWVKVSKMFEAMKKHREKNSAGFWELFVNKNERRISKK